MGKRKKNREEKMEHIKNKIRKLEDKLKEKTNYQEILTAPSPEPEITENDIVSEDLLMALGEEGEDKSITGEPIHQELASRWTKIMAEGLGKEAKQKILDKYPSPSNFTASPPIMNPELLAAMSESSLKRDKRLVYRQELSGKILSIIGKTLTNVLKGNINSKEIVEQLSDAAKVTAETYKADLSSRKFFALSGASKVVQEAVKNEKTDELLFGKNCAEKIRAAQTLQKTSALVRAPDKKPKTDNGQKKVNWRSPLPQKSRSGQYQQYQQPMRNQYNRPPQRTKGQMPRRLAAQPQQHRR